MLKSLRVTRPPNTYLMLISYRSEDPQLAADAANAIAQSYLEHTYNIRVRSSASLATFMERQLDELKVKMDRSSQALAAFERELTVINPEEKTNILGSRLLQLNTDYTTAQTERLRKQAAWNRFGAGRWRPRWLPARRCVAPARGAPEGSPRAFCRRRPRTTAPTIPNTAGQGAARPGGPGARWHADRHRQRVEIEFRESQRREQMAGQAVAEAKAEFDKVNARSFEYQALKREADADKTLYDELVRKIKEAGINAGFQNSAIRIADPARPPLKPVSPNIPLNALLALLFSALVAVGAAVVADLLDKTISDPEQVARTLHDRSHRQPAADEERAGRAGAGAAGVSSESGLVEEHDSSGFNESVRTLRNSILLAKFRPALPVAAGDQRRTGRRQDHHRGEPGGSPRRAGPAHAADRRRPAAAQRAPELRSSRRGRTLQRAAGRISWREAVIPVEGLPDLDVLPAGPPSRRAATGRTRPGGDARGSRDRL